MIELKIRQQRIQTSHHRLKQHIIGVTTKVAIDELSYRYEGILTLRRHALHRVTGLVLYAHLDLGARVNRSPINYCRKRLK